MPTIKTYLKNTLLKQKLRKNHPVLCEHSTWKSDGS